ncbi:acyclic terpene utilization AtuA family protein [Gordonia sp. HNM0687]|uniref:Acyclic terpene utilization AtuA family protein n=1 Tax=Gordonia mangrovi TaxID=2665643 RepID=A0A6L7GTX4_9ACTN|nr:acyclic terpene utilization AtuA family protein [Gordonia mangrovi]MXP23464.1 acyclic terpene utilization AtuA family protein [Gordonia mangrovi]UVF76640.1 DUF1446 domain-containing protein [Gordonia mangrovi]
MAAEATRGGLRIGNFSGFYGDRHDSISELLDAGVDYLTGDYLAELTMLILRKNQRAGRPAYAAGFVGQLRSVLPRIADDGVKLVCNAGGLDPLGCADAVRELCDELGVNLTVAAITGDDVLGDIPRLVSDDPQSLRNIDTGTDLPVEPDSVLAANAYLGAWPIAAALRGGADIVICPRVTDASLVIGPAAHHFGWKADDFDRLAGALWAGHAIECGGQVTGGNYSFFYEEPAMGIPPMPIAELFDDGTSIITKSKPDAGAMTIDTVKSQLLYEVSGPLYHNPDVIGDLRTVQLEAAGPDAVRIFGATGYAPTDTAKLSVCFDGGYRNSITIGLTGLRVDEKLTWLGAQIDALMPKIDELDSYRWTVIGPKDPEHGTIADATAWLVITARSTNAAAVGRRAFTGAITQLGVSSIPGCYFAGPPQSERSAAVQWPCLIHKHRVEARVHLTADDDGEHVDWPAFTSATKPPALAAEDAASVAQSPTEGLVEIHLSDHFGTRSGDKAGLANIGVWARDAESFEWLRRELTVELFSSLVPETAGMKIDRHVMPGILGINFVVHGWLEDGAASSTNIDNQAKGLGEYLGSRIVVVPARLLGPTGGNANKSIGLDIAQNAAVTG